MWYPKSPIGPSQFFLTLTFIVSLIFFNILFECVVVQKSISQRKKRWKYLHEGEISPSFLCFLYLFWPIDFSTLCITLFDPYAQGYGFVIFKIAIWLRLNFTNRRKIFGHFWPLPKLVIFWGSWGWGKKLAQAWNQTIMQLSKHVQIPDIHSKLWIFNNQYVLRWVKRFQS